MHVKPAHAKIFLPIIAITIAALLYSFLDHEDIKTNNPGVTQKNESTNQQNIFRNAENPQDGKQETSIESQEKQLESLLNSIDLYDDITSKNFLVLSLRDGTISLEAISKYYKYSVNEEIKKIITTTVSLLDFEARRDFFLNALNYDYDSRIMAYDVIMPYDLSDNAHFSRKLTAISLTELEKEELITIIDKFSTVAQFPGINKTVDKRLESLLFHEDRDISSKVFSLISQNDNFTIHNQYIQKSLNHDADIQDTLSYLIALNYQNFNDENLETIRQIAKKNPEHALLAKKIINNL